MCFQDVFDEVINVVVMMWRDLKFQLHYILSLDLRR